MLVKILKTLLPTAVVRHIQNWKNKRRISKELKYAYEADLSRYSLHSGTFDSNSKQKKIGRIIREYHVIEKGLTMPDTRMGFGKDLFLDLITHCIEYVDLYGDKDEQFTHAVSVIFEYELFHRKKKFELDPAIVNSINSLKRVTAQRIIGMQKEMTIDDYFKDVNSIFPLFAASRSSVRNYSNIEVPSHVIISALELSRTTPSACNRQCWRTYLFESKEKINEILTIQGGNRGFGHLSKKLIIITSEIGVFSSVSERNQVFIDGGMYAMNLLYSLHYNKIGACILNCSNTIEKDIKLRKLCGVKDSEVFVAMIACGIPPSTFKIATSHRYGLESTNIIIE